MPDISIAFEYCFSQASIFSVSSNKLQDSQKVISFVNLFNSFSHCSIVKFRDFITLLTSDSDKLGRYTFIFSCSTFTIGRDQINEYTSAIQLFTFFRESHVSQKSLSTEIASSISSSAEFQKIELISGKIIYRFGKSVSLVAISSI
ncbi:MAG: hypothetical protein P1U46_00125 [Patescibacteria group bacterium]|nr:hypothetical protein [Patescibacteria group bacterium]